MSRPARPGTPRALAVSSLAVLLGACDGPQSALVAAGHEAERLVTLFWWMLGGAALIWTVVIGLAVYAVHVHPEQHPEREARLLIVGGGVVFPVVVLAALLAWGLRLMPELRTEAPADALRIEIAGERWWWRVRYVPSDGEPFELANELRLPVGRPAELVLTSPDVIHSFWVPSIAGKLDMIPGRVTRMTIEPTRRGLFRGACAEYCGGSHALMALWVSVVEPAEFDTWAAAQRQPARAIDGRGPEVFLWSGCGACHTVRGTAADGRMGPDLTHVGSRLSLAAATLPNDRDAFRRFVLDPRAIKPEAHMPAYAALGDEELDTLAEWLESLQ